MEEGETPEACIRREMLEEIELEFDALYFFRTYKMPDRDDFTFWISLDLDIERVVLHEGQALKWFSEAEIAGMDESRIAFGFRSVLMDFLRERPWISLQA